MSALVNQLPAEQAPHIAAIVDQIKSQGIFDTLRKECLADVDTKVSKPVLLFSALVYMHCFLHNVFCFFIALGT